MKNIMGLAGKMALQSVTLTLRVRSFWDIPE